jgi:hypothetical protein
VNTTIIGPSHLRIRTLTFLLRVVAVSALLSGISFYLPASWINSFLAWCGLPGPMPDAVLMRYVLLGAGNLQVGIGVVIWVIARDVVRHQPIVIAVLVAILVAAPVFFLTNALAGLPRYWCFVDFSCCFLAGAVPLTVSLWPAKKPPAGMDGTRAVPTEANQATSATVSRNLP